MTFEMVFSYGVLYITVYIEVREVRANFLSVQHFE